MNILSSNTKINKPINYFSMSLVCLCASHIKNTLKLKKLQNMLISWNDQHEKIKLIISISYDDDIKQEFINTLSEITHYEHLIIHVEKTQKKQFEHYEIICKKYEEYLKDKWVIFTDDDDIWLPDRSATFINLIKSNPTVEFILYPFIYSSNIYCNNSITVMSLVDNVFTKSRADNVSEYVCFCVRFHNLKNFTTEKNTIIVDKDNNVMKREDIISHDFSDRYFIAFLKITSKSNYKKITDDTLSGIYYYWNTKYSPINEPIFDTTFFTYIN